MTGNGRRAQRKLEFHPNRSPLHSTFAPGQVTDVPDVHYALSLSPSSDTVREKYWANVFAHLSSGGRGSPE
jgi:hypothetical protein